MIIHATCIGLTGNPRGNRYEFEYDGGKFTIPQVEGFAPLLGKRVIITIEAQEKNDE